MAPIAIRFLVDTGAVYTVLPEKVWRALKLTPTRGVSECRFTVEGHSATWPAVLGGTDDAPLLGAVTLQTLGLMVNPPHPRVAADAVDAGRYRRTVTTTRESA